MSSRRFYPLEGGTRDLPWIALYAVTFGLQLVCGLIRGALLYIPLQVAFMISGHDPNALTDDVILYVVTLGPLAWSLSALVYPVAAGEIWRASAGGRPPSEREREIVEHAITDLQGRDPGVRRPGSWFVLDDPTHNAAVLGDALAINTGAIDDPGFAATLAHELGHLNSTDGHLIAALVRWRRRRGSTRASRGPAASRRDASLPCSRWSG
jgi:Zn-dependent protease with chaperone function